MHIKGTKATVRAMETQKNREIQYSLVLLSDSSTGLKVAQMDRIIGKQDQLTRESRIQRSTNQLWR